MQALIRGHTAHFELHGTAGPRVLMVMGFSMSGEAWRPQFERLSQDHQVLVYDNRGVGRSTGPEVHDLRELADDAAALLDHVGWQQTHVVGVSLGGMVSQHLALRHIERVRSLTLIASHPGGKLRHTLPRPLGAMRFLRANTASGERRLAALRTLLFPRHHRKAVHKGSIDPSILESVGTGVGPRTALGQLRAIFEHDVTDELGRLHDLPALVIKPSRDILVPPHNSDRLHRLLPNAELVVLPDAGHGANVQEAVHVNAAIARHVARAEPSDEARPQALSSTSKSHQATSQYPNVIGA